MTSPEYNWRLAALEALYKVDNNKATVREIATISENISKPMKRQTVYIALHNMNPIVKLRPEQNSCDPKFLKNNQVTAEICVSDDLVETILS